MFLAALLAAIVRPDLTADDPSPPARGRARFAAAAASFVVEAPGLLGVPDDAAVARPTRRLG